MVRADSYRISRVPQYSGVCIMKSEPFRLQDFHLLRRDLPIASAMFQIFDFTRLLQQPDCTSLYPVYTTLAGFNMYSGLGSFRFARHYSGNHFVFSSSRYLDVSLPWVRLPFRESLRITGEGLPHSDTCGSMVACTSPQLFAAYHVLLRLLVPRHPPYALSNLTLYFLTNSVVTNILSQYCQRTNLNSQKRGVESSSG